MSTATDVPERKKRRGIKILLALVTLIALALWAVQPEYPTVATSQGSVARTGQWSGELPRNPEVLWTYETINNPHEAVTADGVLYFGEGDNLHAVGVYLGHRKWMVKLGDGSISSAPVIHGDLVIVSHGEGVTAVRRSDGLVKWNHPITGGGGGGSPTLIGDLVVVGAGDGNAYALTAGGGAIVWSRDLLADAPPPVSDQSPLFGSLKARPQTAASDGRTIYMPIFDQGRIVALDVETGDKKWSFASSGWMGATPTVIDGAIIAGSQDQNVYALGPGTGEVLWQHKTGSRVGGSAAWDGEQLYVGSCDSKMYCLNPKTGEEIWSTSTGNVVYAAPWVTADSVVFGGFDGFLYCLDKEAGEERWKLQIASAKHNSLSTLTTDGKRLFLVANKSLVAVGDSQWRWIP